MVLPGDPAQAAAMVAAIAALLTALAKVINAMRRK
jgi:hypothetical protein